MDWDGPDHLTFLTRPGGWSFVVVLITRASGVKTFYLAGEPPEHIRPACERLEKDLHSLWNAEGFDGCSRRWGKPPDPDLKTKSRLTHRLTSKLSNLFLQRSHTA
jgi:hypothetical protein